MIKIKLWEYVLENDKEADFIKWRSGKNNLGDKLLIYDYCPMYFDCFNGTEFEIAYKLKNKKGDCKYQEASHKTIQLEDYNSKEQFEKDFLKEYKICSECWNREIKSKTDEEYETYLKLKEKFEKL